MWDVCGATEHLIRTGWRLRHLGICKTLGLLQAAWDAFSRPVPTGCGQLLAQVVLCACLAGSAAGLLHRWLCASHLDLPEPSTLATAVCGLLLFLSLGLVPPIRCLFALSLPTLGTQQGRQLLLSYSTATLAAAVVPNILANVAATGQVLRCVTEGSLESLINTTQQLQAASQTLGPASQVGSRGLTFETQGDGSAFRRHVLRATQQILEDFSGLETQARRIARGAQWMATGLFMLGLLAESAWYLHRYLTDLRFDNIYLTRQLAQQLAQSRATHLLASSAPSWLLQATRSKLSREELLSCLLRLGLLGLLLVATALTVATDHVTFILAQVAVDWAQKLPTAPITLTVKYDASYTILDFIPFLFNQPPPQSPYVSAQHSYHWELRFTSPACPLLPAQRPGATAPLTAGALQLMACTTLLLQTYAWRLRHTIAAAFFPAQEARRAGHLRARLQQRHERLQGPGVTPT
uniref:osteoclast stimulatory transmembrane protein n=1 Tax=Jaculus jaculus TaxID=51337 RepID=UPI001E1B08C8|nr:osteoclast stimulatory transmembrane protein [Jaculus jaculus]